MNDTTVRPAAGSGLTHSDSVDGHVIKMCCVCGADVTHQLRFKDKQGHYWCEDCQRANKQPDPRGPGVPCPDCQQLTPRDKLIENGKDKVCELCNGRRVKAAKREQARIAAAQEEERHQQSMRKRMIIAGAIVAAAAIGFAARAMFM